jgi:hypothetical protein
VSPSPDDRRPAAQILALISSHLTRAELEAGGDRTDLLEIMQRWGDAWQAHARALGVPCPPALVELADAMADVYVSIRADHGWDLLTPDASHEARTGLVDLAAWVATLGKEPEKYGRLLRGLPGLEARARMAPVLGQDGDLLLLAADGRVHAFTHDAWEDDGVAAPSFDALLLLLAEQARARRR